MGIVRRKNGYYYGRVRISGKNFKKSFRTKTRSQAEKLYEIWFTRLFSVDIQRPAAGEPKEKPETPVADLKTVGEEYLRASQTKKFSKGTNRVKEKLMESILEYF